MSRMRIVIVEDDDGLRESLAALVDREAGFELAGGFASAEEALAAWPGDVKVALIDIHLGGMSGIELVARLKERDDGVLALMLTVYDDTGVIFQALQAGASGYLLKRHAPTELIGAIREVHGGGSPMSPTIARKVVGYFQNGGGVPAPELEQLAPRERQVLELLAKGLLYKEIAAELGIAIDTVRTHVRRTYEKLHVRSRTEAVSKLRGGG